MANGPVKLNAKQVVADIRSGADYLALMTRYGLSRSQMDNLLKKLIKLKLIEAPELAHLAIQPTDKPCLSPNSNDSSDKIYNSEESQKSGTYGSLVKRILYFCFLYFLWYIAVVVILIFVNAILEITTGFKIEGLVASVIVLVLPLFIAFYGAAIRYHKP